jgi:hypothetical protein
MADALFLDASAAVALAVIGLLSVPAVINLSAQLRQRDPKPEVYEDADGKSTPEATKSFSAKIPKAFIVVFSVIGLGLSIALAVLSTLDAEDALCLENWLSSATWVSESTPKLRDGPADIRSRFFWPSSRRA